MSVAFAVVVLAISVGLGVPAAAAGEAPSSTTSTTIPDVPAQDIIPEPNSGRAPEEAGDRGGAAQIAVFVLLLAGIGTIGFLAVRSARRARPT